MDRSTISPEAMRDVHRRRIEQAIERSSGVVDAILAGRYRFTSEFQKPGQLAIMPMHNMPAIRVHGFDDRMLDKKDADATLPHIVEALRAIVVDREREIEDELRTAALPALMEAWESRPQGIDLTKQRIMVTMRTPWSAPMLSDRSEAHPNPMTGESGRTPVRHPLSDAAASVVPTILNLIVPDPDDRSDTSWTLQPAPFVFHSGNEPDAMEKLHAMRVLHGHDGGRDPEHRPPR